MSPGVENDRVPPPILLELSKPPQVPYKATKQKIGQQVNNLIIYVCLPILAYFPVKGLAVWAPAWEIISCCALASAWCVCLSKGVGMTGSQILLNGNSAKVGK
jgi:hypothetical protein